MALLALLAGCADEVDIDPPRAASSQSAPGDAHARLVDQLAAWLNGSSRTSAEQLATADAVPLLEAARRNAVRLRIEDVALRYVDESPASANTSTVTAELSYRLAGFDREPARMETAIKVQDRSGRSRITGFGVDGTRTPVWLTGPMAVRRGEGWLVAVRGSSVGRYGVLVRRALRQVERVLGRPPGGVAVLVPRSQQGLDAAVDASPGEYDQIAAVTTTADGSLGVGAPVRVFVNPTVFGDLKVRGAQVVMSHEVTHAVTKAPFASMPTWLLEGFADYVALDGTGIPVATAARQVLDRIRKDGLPDGLPSSAELEPTATDLGATYEEAWLACRFLAQQHGSRKMVRFYRAVDRGASTREAFRSVLGTSQRQFVADWKRDLRRLVESTD